MAMIKLVSHIVIYYYINAISNIRQIRSGWAKACLGYFTDPVISFIDIFCIVYRWFTARILKSFDIFFL